MKYIQYEGYKIYEALKRFMILRWYYGAKYVVRHPSLAVSATSSMELFPSCN